MTPVVPTALPPWRRTMNTTPSAPDAAERRTIDIELLALDLKTCTRCVGTLGNIETAVGTLRAALDATGTDVRLRKVLIESEEQARRHRFVSSPTVRINGRDVA